MKNSFGKHIKLFIYLIIVVLVNVAAVTLFFRLDLTANRIYSLSQASKKVVATLSEPLTINVFFTRNLPPPHNQTERYLHDLLEEYAIHSNRFFNYRFYDVSPEGDTGELGAMENQKLAKSYGIYPVQIQAVEQDEVKFKKAYLGMVLIHGDLVERIPTITSTNGLEYKLTTTMQKLNNKISALLSLKDKVRITLFLSSSLKQVAQYMGLKELSEYATKVGEIVTSLNKKSYGKLQYIYQDPSSDKDIESLRKSYNIMNLKWPSLLHGKIQAGRGVIGLVMEHKDRVLEIPILRVLRLPIIGTQYRLMDLDKIEETLNDNLETLININEGIGYLADHGTLPVSGASPMGRQNQNVLSSFSALVSQNYTLKRVNLREGLIPGNLNSLIIARPTEKFSEYELFQIDQALMRGTQLALFLDAFNEVMPQNRRDMAFNRGPGYIPIDTGLEKLLTHYGIRVKKSFVLDENSYRQPVSRRFGGGEQPIYFAPVIKNKNINNDLDFMKQIKGLVALKISPLELNKKRIDENRLRAYKLFSSSAKSWEMNGNIMLNPMFITPPTSETEKSSIPLAYLLEGEFPSYFVGKSIPEKKSESTDSKTTDKKDSEKIKPGKKPSIDLSKIQGGESFLAKGKPSKIFLIGSSEMLKDSLLDPEGKGPNAVFIMNILDVMNHRENIASMRG
ncbi:MAG: Gldg family protein, partial [Desulfobacterales bacterium]